MAATHGVGTSGNGAGTVTPLDHKMGNLTHWLKTAANTIRPGLLWDGNATVITGKANMSYDVRAFSAVLTRGATAGAVELTNDGVVNVTTTAAPGSNSRIDVVYLWQREFSIEGTDSNPVIGVVQGTAAASPSAPSLSAFPGAIELGRATVPAGITATTSATITQTAPFTAVDGGTVAVRNTTERDAYVPATADINATCWIIGGFTYRWSGAAWQPYNAPVPIFQVGRGSAQMIPNTTWTLAAAAYDTPGLNVGFTSFTGGALTIATTGWYRITVRINWVFPLASTDFQVTVNTTSVDTAGTLLGRGTNTGSASSNTDSASGLFLLTAADVLRLYVYTSSANNLGANPRDLNLSVEWVRGV